MGTHNRGALGENWFSKRLVLAYVIDWAFIIFIGVLGRIMKLIEPNRRPFSLTDQSISYPFARHERVPVVHLLIASLFVPAATIALFSLVLVPAPTGHRIFGADSWRRKFWEWNAGWMGLGVAYNFTYTVTEAMKVMFGKPRPDLLDRCNPNISNITSHVIGGLGGKITGAPSLVAWTICQNQTKRLSQDGFVSFPSGHASMSFAGLTYLALWLCAKFAVSIPYLSSSRSSSSRRPFHAFDESTSVPSTVPLRDQGAAPPLYLLTLLFAPIMAATYIASSRWVDNRHFGFDLISGSLLGIGLAWFGFRLFHLPLDSGQGWALAPRNKHRAFFGNIDDTSYGEGEDVLDSGHLRHHSLHSSIEQNEHEMLPASEARLDEHVR
ncbi:hypothetical protein LOZ39_001935 [Ophidiomyces ophidiicola]|nr:hypothetical protein LOZ49_000846 [Ophidiomyces ophidiicola]KAI2057841.1 hypothetical protein LOZ44_001325 [Ophidiomyces ophidiicola]KAI2077937.1 hypothetical protein LOZ39_001935 [Ophidiomyces ophidiicola]KAI2141465.1 hypothetical protein LOZ28_002541 [Ophidiomyces ophidiicola]KAI2146361.1 hypothetical protein LOZ29_000117 [Ophidiomyces ophidiicola]